MTVIKIENLWKEYHLGVIGHGTLTHDLQSWWAKVRGKEDPNAQIAPMLAEQDKQIDGDRFWALRDINLEVKQGEILGIIGRNGAGKSTLLKILSRVTAPTKGNIKVKGRIASLLEVGTGFHPELTGRENIFMNGAILGMSKQEIKAKLDEIIDFSGVEQYIETPVKRYSSGMRVRLAFSVAAHLEPEILVIDEVLAVGDVEFQKKCLGKMDSVARAGRTVLFVSHNMASIQNLCGSAILLKHGAVSRNGSVEDIISSYLLDSNIKHEGGYSNLLDPPNKFVWITSAKIIVNKKNSEKVLSGQDVQFEFEYKAKREKLACTLFVGVYTHLGEKILHLGTPYDGKKIFLTKERGRIKLTIFKFPLTSGQYTINISLHLDGKPHDRVQGAMTLTVGSGDFYDNGEIPPVNEAKFLVQQSWIVDNG
ncbi:MAG: lipopolysaccharide transport system ATP-binding protein [Desulforhopalus sp.]|jgi:lipopolysaccharide transport system ATP-binding protein